MSKHSTSALTMRDALYEAPGPKMRAKIRIGTAISLVAVAALLAVVLQRFYMTGQLSVHYWYFFTHLTTWKFLLAGFEGTVKVALTAGAIALVLGLALMLGRTSDIKPLQLVCRVLTDFFRGVPSLLFIYFFFLVLPQYKIALPSFWMLTLPVALAAAGVLAEIFRAGVNAVPRGQVEAAQALGLSKAKITFKIVLPQAIRFIIPVVDFAACGRSQRHHRRLRGELPRPHAKCPRAHHQLRRPCVGLPGDRGHLYPHQRRD